MSPGSAPLSDGPFRVGEWLVQPRLNQLSRGETIRRLRPKVMDVLVQLAATPADVVSREAILDVVWAKKFLDDTALSRAIFELREALGDDPQASSYIETIPKRGYRLIAPVVRVDPHPHEPPAGGAGRSGSRRGPAVAMWAGAAAIVVGALLVAARSGLLRSRLAPARAVRVAVLPFQNLGASDDAYFAAGIADEISGRLVSVPGVSVTSHDSAARYAGSKLSQREIGRELGVDFVLGGAIRWERERPGANRVLITPKLVRTADGTIVWANAYERVLEDIFGVQSEIATSVIGGIGLVAQSRGGGGADRRTTSNVEAYQVFLKGRFYAGDLYRTEQDLRLGLRMHERAVELDPAFAIAWGEIALVRATLYHAGFERSEASRDQARRALDRAMALDAASARIHYDAGIFHYWCYRDYGRALEELALARSAGGDSTDLSFAEAAVLRRQGRWEDALHTLEAAARLDPRSGTIHRELGLTSLFMHRFADAGRYFEETIALAPDESEPYGLLAEAHWCGPGGTTRAGAVLASMPRADEARPTRWLFWQDVYRGDAERGLERLLATPFDVVDDSENWESRSFLLGRAYWFLGRVGEARRQFETARGEIERLLARRSDDYSLRSTLGVCLAGLGRKEEAIREGRRALELVALKQDRLSTSSMARVHAEILTMAGEPRQACAQLDALLAMPSRLSTARLRLDPTWAPLRSQACFAELLSRHPGE